MASDTPTLTLPRLQGREGRGPPPICASAISAASGASPRPSNAASSASTRASSRQIQRRDRPLWRHEGKRHRGIPRSQISPHGRHRPVRIEDRAKRAGGNGGSRELPSPSFCHSVAVPPTVPNRRDLRYLTQAPIPTIPFGSHDLRSCRNRRYPGFKLASTNLRTSGPQIFVPRQQKL